MDALLTVALGCLLGFLIGLTGTGGGALTAPVFYVLLGIPYTDSVKLSLIYSMLTKLISVGQHLIQGNIAGRLTWIYGLAGVPGAVLGSRLLYVVTGSGQRFFPLLMAGLLLLVSALLFLEACVISLAAGQKPFDPERIGGTEILAISAFSFIVGAVIGTTSVGSGSLIILSMVFLFQMPARQIVGTNIAVALIMVIPAALAHIGAGGIDLHRLGLLLVGSLLGTIPGSRATRMISDRGLRVTMAFLLLLGAVSTIIKTW